ncbi:MAG: hypothetical protein U1A78_34450 [Polyangia bacterium]
MAGGGGTGKCPLYDAHGGAHGEADDLLGQLSSALGARTQDANRRVAERLAAPGADPQLVARIAAGLATRDARLRGDCAEVLTQVAERQPQRVAPYAPQLVALLEDRNGRVRWESAHALALIAALVPERMAGELASLAAILRHDPSVIVRDYLLDAVAGYAATSAAAAGAALPILFEGLELFGRRHAGRVLRGLTAVAASCPGRVAEIVAAAEPLCADPRPVVRKAAAALLRARR